jgi:ketosteroid isomerase-like protein
MLIGIPALTLSADEGARKDTPRRAAAVTAQSERSKAEIKKVLEDQQRAWNRGDLDGFLDGYIKSPDLVFTSEGHIYHGWQTMQERFKKNYAKENMGQLSFEILDIDLLGNDAATVLGRWQLKREKDQPGGVFTLIFRRTPQGWKIVHDHTSRKAVQ